MNEMPSLTLKTRLLGPQAEMLKVASISLCSNVPGQIATGLMVTGKQPMDAVVFMARNFTR